MNSSPKSPMHRSDTHTQSPGADLPAALSPQRLHPPARIWLDIAADSGRLQREIPGLGVPIRVTTDPHPRLQPVEAWGPSAGNGAEAPPAEPVAPTEEPVTYSMSPGLSAFLGANKIALAVSSYQSGKFYLLGQDVDGGLMVHERFFRKAMGVCIPDRDTILLATLFRFLAALSRSSRDHRVYR
jgi:hypothetical protein